MQALDQNTEALRRPQPILAGDGDGQDDTPPEWCQRCYEQGRDHGYRFGCDVGFRDGAGSVRAAPFINWNWSTLAGGIINTLGFVLMLLVAGWIGELRGMKAAGKLEVHISEKADKVVAEPTIRGINGTTVQIVPKGQ